MNFFLFTRSFYKCLKENNIKLSLNYNDGFKFLELVSKESIDYKDAVQIHFKIYLEYLKEKDNTFLKNIFLLSKEMQLKDDNVRNLYFLELKEQIMKY